MLCPLVFHWFYRFLVYWGLEGSTLGPGGEHGLAGSFWCSPCPGVTKARSMRGRGTASGSAMVTAASTQT